MSSRALDGNDFDRRWNAMYDLKQSLCDHIQKWVDANCSDNAYWSEAWFAPETPGRMTEAAWAVFQSSRDGQRFKDREEA